VARRRRWPTSLTGESLRWILRLPGF